MHKIMGGQSYYLLGRSYQIKMVATYMHLHVLTNAYISALIHNFKKSISNKREDHA